MHNINWHQKISPSPIPPKRSKSSYPTPYILFNLLHTDKAKRDTLYKTPHPTLPSCWCEIDSNLIPSLKFIFFFDGDLPKVYDTNISSMFLKPAFSNSTSN